MKVIIIILVLLLLVGMGVAVWPLVGFLFAVILARMVFAR